MSNPFRLSSINVAASNGHAVSRVSGGPVLGYVRAGMRNGRQVYLWSETNAAARDIAAWHCIGETADFPSISHALHAFLDPAPPAAPVASDPAPADVPCYLAVSTDGAGVETVMGVFRVAEHASPQAAEAEASKLCDRIRAAAPGSICCSRYSEGANEADIARAVSGGWTLETGAGEPPTSWRRIRDGLLDRVPTAADACRMMDRETAMVPQVAQQQQAKANRSDHKPDGEPCERCQGNGEIVTDWKRYLHGEPGDVGDESTADCPNCGGTGKIEPGMVPQPCQPQQGRDMRRGMARCEVPGEWQIGIWCVTRQPGGTWEALATGPGTIGDGSPHSYPTLAAAYLGLTGEPMPGASRE